MADFLDNIVSAWGDDDTEDDNYPDETNSPNVNILIRTARKYLDDKVDKEEFLDEVYQTLDRLEQALAEHRALYETSEIDKATRELADKADDAYEEFRGGLIEMESAEAEDVSSGIEIIKSAAFRLEEANNAFIEIQQRSMLVECVMCSHPNQPTSEHCEKCNAALPKTMEKAAATTSEAASNMVMVPPEYLELYEACDKVASDEIDLEVWQDKLDEFVERFNQASQQIHDNTRRFKQVLDEVPGLMEESENLVDALDEALESLNEMQLFATDRDPEHLNQGWMALLVATQKIQQRGMDFYKTLEDAQAAKGAAD